MREVLAMGRTGALLIVCDTPSKFEIVSCWGYDAKSESWAQGHYFTSWNGDKTKAEVIAEATEHFNANYK